MDNETKNILESSTRHGVALEHQTKLAQPSSLLTHSLALDKKNNAIPLSKHDYEF